MKRLLIVLVGIVLISGSLWYLAGTKNAEAPGDGLPDSELTTYQAFDFSFMVPKKYYLDEKNLSTGERSRHAIVLTEDTEENRQVREGNTPPREGPTAITVDLFQNNLDNYNAESWIRGTNDSNFKLSPDGMLTQETLAGKEAYAYRWSGLYEGKSVVVATDAWVYMFSVTWMTPEDTIVSDFEEILKTVVFK